MKNVLLKNKQVTSSLVNMEIGEKTQIMGEHLITSWVRVPGGWIFQADEHPFKPVFCPLPSNKKI